MGLIDTITSMDWRTIALIAIILGFLAFIIYLDYRYTRGDASKPRNPVFIAIMTGLFCIFILMILEFYEVLPEGWSKENWWIYIVIGLVSILVAWYELRRMKPMPMHKLERRVWEIINRRTRAKPHRGDAFGPPILAHNTVDTKEGGAMGKSVNFLVRTTLEGGAFIFVSLDMNNGYPLRYREKPDKIFVERELGRQIVQQFDLERDMMNRANTVQDNYGDQMSNENKKNQNTV